MPFNLTSYLPSQKKEVQISELYYKQYRDLVKSLYSANKKETVLQYNSILVDLCPDIRNIDITFEDKLSLLLTIRNYCVSPDLKLKATTPDKNVFNISILMEDLIKQIKTIEKSFVYEHPDLTVEVSSYKARDEYEFIGNNKDISCILASCVDVLKIKDQKVIFKDLNFATRLQLINTLPGAIAQDIYQNILEVEAYYEAQDFIVVINPLNKERVLTITKNITYETLQQIISFIFTEELNNIYRAFYNMVKHAGFSPEYVDGITPIEIQVYWMYFMEEESKKSTAKETTGAALPSSSVNTELGF